MGKARLLKRALSRGLLVCTLLQLAWSCAKSRSPPRATADPDEVLLPTLPRLRDHPIDHIIADAQAEWDAKLKRQSKTLDQAVREYQRRYGRMPPEGFAEWYHYANNAGYGLIDEFDSLMRSLEPFWALSPHDLRDRTTQLGLQPTFSLVMSDGNRTAWKIGRDVKWKVRGNGFTSMLNLLLDKPGVGRMAFAFNELAEPRVLSPWQEQLQINEALSRGLYANLTNDINATFPSYTWDGDGTTWQSFVATCPPGSSARRSFEPLEPHVRDEALLMGRNYTTRRLPGHLSRAARSTPSASALAFQKGATSATHEHFCSHPHEALMQGMFYSDFRSLTSLYPVFSPSTAAGFSDIVVPTHYWWAKGYFDYHLYHRDRTWRCMWWQPRTDYCRRRLYSRLRSWEWVSWSKRKAQIFWRGSPTGGGNNKSGHQLGYQRQRLLALAHESNQAAVNVSLPVPMHGSGDMSIVDKAGYLNRHIFDVGFSSKVGCGLNVTCDALNTGPYRRTKKVSTLRLMDYKLVLDLDGMAYSARIMSLFESGAAVLKSTVFTDFFVDTIQPWVHYIPLSSTYDEVYNIYAYFLGSRGEPQPSTLIGKLLSWWLDEPNTPIVGKPNRGANEDKLAEIGRSGRQWQREYGEKVAMQVFTYRLLLEWSRLWSRDGIDGFERGTTLYELMKNSKKDGL